jgi:hypothetical protein
MASGKVLLFPLRNRLYDIEHFLAQYDKDVKSSNTSDLNKTLEYLLKNFRRKMIVFVITDIKGASEVSEAVLKKLICQHDILFVQVNDADLTGGRSFKVENNRYLPRFVTMNKKLASMEKNIKKKITEENEKKLMHHAILSTNVSGKDDITMKITELLERHRYANIR